MSAALQSALMWGTGRPEVEAKPKPQPAPAISSNARTPEPDASLAFYRKHTESLLRRYLYASMQVGRAPSLLADSVGRGWVSSRPVRSFEDAVIFVLDVESCLSKLVFAEHSGKEASIVAAALGLDRVGVTQRCEVKLHRF